MLSAWQVNVAQTTHTGVEKFKFGVEGATLYRYLKANFFSNAFCFCRFLRTDKPRRLHPKHNQSYYKTHVASHFLIDTVTLLNAHRTLYTIAVQKTAS